MTEAAAVTGPPEGGPPGDETWLKGAAAGSAAAGSRLTAVSGDAVTNNDRRRPAHRHAAHEARSTSSGSGPTRSPSPQAATPDPRSGERGS